MGLQGYTKLELLRNYHGHDEVVFRTEKHNAITGWVDNIINAGNFHFGMDKTKIQPITQWFSGCLLTDTKNVTQDYSAINNWCIAPDATIVACAGDDGESGYAGAYVPRGYLSSVNSGPIGNNGYKFVFYWDEGHGNGTINSVCLTRSELGKVEIKNLGEGATWLTTTPADVILGNVNGISSALYDLQLIDYDNEIGYNISYANNIISVKKYMLNTKRSHLMGSTIDVIGQIGQTHEIAQEVDDYGNYRTTVCLDEDGDIHLITIDGNKLNDYIIDTSAWTVTEINRNYSNANFCSFAFSGIVPNAVRITKEEVSGTGYTFYTLWGDSGKKIAKCRSDADAQITFISDNPMYTEIGVQTGDLYAYNGSIVELPNGDWYKFGGELNGVASGANCVYYHNGAFRLVKSTTTGYYSAYQCYGTVNSGKGSILTRCRDTGYGIDIKAIFPYVSTVNDLSAEVVKNNTLKMTLTYEITET